MLHDRPIHDILQNGFPREQCAILENDNAIRTRSWYRSNGSNLLPIQQYLTGDVCVATNGGENWSSILPVAGITSRTGATPERLAILSADQQEWAFLTMTDGQEQVLLRSGDRGQTWEELLAVPSNATMSGSGSRMGIVVPRDTTLYYESPNP